MGHVSHVTVGRWACAVLGAVMLSASARAAAPIDPAQMMPIAEIRQYKITAGNRDRFIQLFDREFVETQEAVGMKMVGQFRDLDDPNRFVWIRAFKDMPSRAEALTSFYAGPVWQAHRNEANPLLDDNDNVLFLHEAAAQSGFAPDTRPRPTAGAAPTHAGLVVATIYYLWKAPEEGFASFFEDRMKPALHDSGIDVLADFVPESTPNNFPKLPVRQGEKLFVWFARFDDAEAYAKARTRLEASAAWHDGVGAALADRLERTPQILRLEPTARSQLR